MTGPRPRAAADGVAFAVLVERAARALHVVQPALFLGLDIEIDKSSTLIDR